MASNYRELAPAAAVFQARQRVPDCALLQVDWTETTDDHIFEANVPGFDIEDIKVEVENGQVLVIRGQRKRDDLELVARKGQRWIQERIVPRSFLRRFGLPGDADAEEAEAILNNGILTVTIPKQSQRTWWNKKPKMKIVAVYVE